ncbi:hypothetical protein VNO78_34247 [Psophocarpus tetragonolobus]|uniref:Uncharacterized protein n=1 Tax=Psophocarpus tetragonolobus TaxID=3891 RepID=A0AAN9RPD7_PSOTE
MCRDNTRRTPSPGSVDFSQRRGQRTAHVAAIRTLHRTIQSVGATGGVYKGQGRASGVLKATSADPWSASFMVETRTLFVFHKSKNFTSDYEIRMPPTVPVNHYSDPEGQHNRIRILWCYPMLMYPERRLALSTLISSKLALQWILVKRFRLYSFQLPDSMSPVLLFIVTTSPCQDWVICAPAAFLGCGSRFSGSLSGIEP